MKHFFNIEREIACDVLTKQVVAILGQHVDTMLQFSEEQIQEFVVKKLAVMLSHPQNPDQLAAFAKLWKWEGLNQRGQTLFEFGSWMVPQEFQGHGFGEAVLFQTLQLGKEHYPNSQFIAVVEEGNTKSQNILLHLGGKLVPKDQWPSNFKILLKEGEASVVVIDISGLSSPNQSKESAR